MSLIPRNSLLDLDTVFDSFFTPAKRENVDGGFFSPRIDVREKESAYEIHAEIPGVKKEDIHVTLENGVLAIEAESRQEDKEEKDGKLIRQERRYGKYVRSFTVGSGVHQEDISAKLDDGVLTITIPKIKEVPPERRRINVS